MLALVMLVGVLAGCNSGTGGQNNADQQGTEQGEINSQPADNQQANDKTPSTQSENNQPEDNEDNKEAAVPESETPMKLQWMQGIGIDTLFEAPAHDIQSLYPQMVFDPLMFLDSGSAAILRCSLDGFTHF